MSEEKTPEDHLYEAKMLEATARYETMIGALHSLVTTNPCLTEDQRLLFYRGFNYVVGAIRTALSCLFSFDNNEDVQRNAANRKRTDEHRKQLHAEMDVYCKEALSLLVDHLIPASSNLDARVFYYKMKAEYHGYIAEIRVGDDKKKAMAEAIEAYAEMIRVSADLPAAIEG